MSSEPEMSDAQFTNFFSIMIGGLILLTIALIILAVIIGSGVNQSDLNAQARDSQVSERIEPAGQITVGEAASSQAAASGSGDAGGTQVASGETVYQNNCAACHAGGVAGAPTYGDAAAWSDRIAQGKDTLYQHAIQGFQGEAGMMPPKGGNTALSDKAVENAVDYMVNAVSETSNAESSASRSGAAESQEAAAESSDTGSSESGSSAGSSDTESAASETSGAESTAAGSSDAAAADAASGETVYQNNCMACHAAGVAGAPKLGDTAAWSDRIAQGRDTLYQHAIQGFQGEAGMMPPKGGFANLSDQAVKNAVDYMVEQSN